MTATLDLLPVTLAEQLAELRREAAMREVVYPQMVAARKLTPGTAWRRQRHLEAAIATLEALAAARDPADA